MMNWNNFEFNNPEFLWLLALIPFIATWFFLVRKKETATLTVSSLKGFNTTSSFLPKLKPLLPIIRLISLTLLIIALARPRNVAVSKKVKANRGIDIVMAIDVSASMLARDLKPNRLEALKVVATNFVNRRPNDRIGIVVYAGESFTQTPITSDKGITRRTISEIKWGQLEGGTAIGMGLGSAVNRLKESEAKSKVIILLTDGVNNSGFVDPKTATELAKELNIKVYTVGIGTNGMADFPFSKDARGRLISFLILALVNPKIGTKLKTVKREGVDVVFALDVSKSMLAEDIAPNRLEKSKQIISKIIDKLGSDRVGIIIYAGNAYPLLPITTDHGAAKMFLQSANPDLVSSQGTAINDALDLAKTYYNNDDQTNRFLIIISDGEDHQEETKQIAQNISNDGIKVYTIGVGTEKGAPIPMKINGSLIGYKKYKGETVLTKRNPILLKGVADAASGVYIDGNLTDKPVKAIEDIIGNAQKTAFETKQFSDYKDQFQWFLGIGILFLLIDVFFLDKKTKWLKKVDLFNEKEN